jgi:phosphinothricin acetyltransferase
MCARTRGARGSGRPCTSSSSGKLVDLGYCQAFAGVALPNAASIALHESVGFEPIGVYRRVGYKHGAWRDVAWWQKTLQEIERPAPPRRFGAAT